MTILNPEVNEDGLTDRENLFLEILFNEAGGDVRAAMTKAGYSTHEPTSKIVKKLNKQIVDRTKDYLAAHGPKAMLSIVAVLSDPNRPGNKDLLSAAKDILDRAKIGTPNSDTNTTPEKNIFILPEKSKVTISTEE